MAGVGSTEHVCVPQADTRDAVTLWGRTSGPPSGSVAMARVVPGVLLLATLATTFLFGHDRGYLYRPIVPEIYLPHHLGLAHNFESAQTLAIAANLSPRKGFLLFIRQHSLPSGEQWHLLYGRFSVVNYALIKLFLLPFGDDMAAGMAAARILMLLFFCAAALLAFDAIRRLAGDPWIALLAVVLAFSSSYCLFYNDAVDTEGSPLLFAVALVFHGMVVFAQQRRFPQLLLKTAGALLLDWHVYGLLFVFVVTGTLAELIHARGALRTLGRSRYVGVGFFALLFGVAVLGFNLGNEYRALGGETALANLPSFDSMLRRTGARSVSVDVRLNLAFFEHQFHGIGLLMSMPYALASFVSTFLENVDKEAPRIAYRVFAIVGVVATASAVVGSVALHVRRRRRGVEVRGAWLLAALCASGFCYAVALWQSTAFHVQEVLAYIGVPLALYSMFGIAVRRLCGERAVPMLAVVGVAAFALSSLQMSDFGHDQAAAERQRVLVRDLAAINAITRGRGNVCVLPSWEAVEVQYGSFVAIEYLLAGSNLVFGDPRRGECPVATDFMLGKKRDQDAELLTPQNQLLFLHRPFDAVASYEAQWRSLVSREPLARGIFDVYLDGRVLHYAKAPCVWEDTEGVFQLTIVPKDRTLLPAHRKDHESFRLIHTFQDEDGVLFNGKCLFSIVLPRYHIVSVVTAQYKPGETGSRWRVWVPIDLPAEGQGDLHEAGALGTHPP